MLLFSILLLLLEVSIILFFSSFNVNPNISLSLRFSFSNMIIFFGIFVMLTVYINTIKRIIIKKIFFIKFKYGHPKV